LSPEEPKPYQSESLNFSYRIPGRPWRRDDSTRDRLHVSGFAFRRTDPGAWVALAVRPYPARVPPPAELREEAVRSLRRLFPDLQSEDDPKGGTVSGKAALRLVYQGSDGDTVMSGDCHILFHQGFAFWLFRWCPAGAVEAVAGELAAMRDRFGLLNQRPDWKPPRMTFAGTKLAFTLTAEGDRWSKAAFAPAEYDPLADLVLVADGREDDPARRATLIVLRLPAGSGGEPRERAKAHVLERQQDVYPESTMAELPAAGTDVAQPVQMFELKVTNRPGRERFILLRVVPQPDGLFVLWSECDFARRALWEDEFRRLAATFRLAD
jgi:hypothetical protein